MLLYFIDAEKVFNRVECPFLKEVLERLGFVPQFRTWIDLIYLTQSTEIYLKGFRSSDIMIHRRVRQGCTLSPVLFNIIIETLAIDVRAAGGKELRLPIGNP